MSRVAKLLTPSCLFIPVMSGSSKRNHVFVAAITSNRNISLSPRYKHVLHTTFKTHCFAIERPLQELGLICIVIHRGPSVSTLLKLASTLGQGRSELRCVNVGFVSSLLNSIHTIAC